MSTSPRRATPWRALGLVFLLYLADPFVAAWQHRGTTAGDLGLLLMVGFVVLYVWHYLSAPLFEPYPPRRAAAATSPWPGRARYTGLLVLAGLATVVVGQAATATWVFVAVAALWTFTGWVPYAIAGVLAVGYEVLTHGPTSWRRDNSQSIAIILAVLGVTSVIVAVRRSRDLSEARRENARLAIEEERNRVARDVHDILGHSLTVIRIKAELAARLVDLDPDRARAEAEQVEALAREALADVRGAVEGFREISLSGELARAREALDAAGIEAQLPRRVDTVDPALRELYAWTVREGVTNVIRHSGARHCTVSIDETGMRLCDDGHVARPGQPGRTSGHGLDGLAERARAAGATLTARRLDPRGFELVLTTDDPPGGAA